MGRPRSSFTAPGVAFDNSRGGLDCKITPGMALTGRFIIFPRREQPEKD